LGAILTIDPLFDGIATTAIRVALRRAWHAAGVDEHETIDTLRMITGMNEADLSAG